MDIQVDYVAILLASIVSMAIGFAWYHEKVFGTAWQRLSGIDPQSSGGKTMQRVLIINGVATLISAFVLAHFIILFGATNAAGAIPLAFWSWLGFMVPVLCGSIAWEGKSFSLFAINAGYQLAQLTAIALVLVSW